ncbi:DNA N-6-adenine-methyltransferase (Dam) [Rivularia sp. PCC 7116]|uniref:DNA N-6-adenine-methyltransferase n=1 Tax=Rivularia sp. PCC 7116 TaxID=373994 RepID=UPI00029EFE3E|nr:DNA N-6-adenine-methyltransferase [Rivularia sp. PCC 7116]AFY54298.1 DNA N-6-adenine-methyltransferase (Dam) [Rivularia sp. PCC 7116]
MTMLFDIEQYRHLQNHKGDWDGVKYDPAWDDGSAFPNTTSKTSSKETERTNKTDCWYSPPHIVELVIQVLGEINLDPCADDGRHIRATKHYTFDDNGLEQSWCGKVYMNPPYSHPGAWMKKLELEFETGNVDEAIALVPAATDTNWLSPVLKTQPVCFWKGRIKFLGQDYQPKLSARQSHVLVYWGNNWQKFREVFEDYGVVYFPIPPVDNDEVLGENILPNNSPSTRIEGKSQIQENNSSTSTLSNTQTSNNNQVLGGNISLNSSPSTRIEDKSQTLDNSSSTSNLSDTQLSNDNQVLGGNISLNNSPSTRIEDNSQTLDNSSSTSILSDTQISNDNQVLGENMSLNNSPSTRIEDNSQILDNSSSTSILSDTQVGNDNQVLGENISLNNSPSTRIDDGSQTLDNSSSTSNLLNAQVSNDNQVLGGNISPNNSPSTHRKRGEGSGNISWGYANANSTKKKPVKQLYFEWEYRGNRGKTYVRSRLKEQVISMNEAKVPVVEILKLLIYNPKVAGALGLN